VGWAPTDDLETLTHRIKMVSKETLIETIPTSRYGNNSQVPVALQNSPLLRPFQMLVTTYARPRYGELDPTILMAVMFPLLYGAMFGDVGQGLVLLLLGLLIDRGVIMKAMKSLGLLIAYCGASAAFFGLMYGSFFGFEGEHFQRAFGFPFYPLAMSPIHQILPLLVLSINVGIVLLFIAYSLAIFNQARSREYAHMLFGHNGLAGFFLYISLLGLLGRFVKDSPITPQIAVGIGSLPLPWGILLLIFGLVIMFSGALIRWMEGHRPIIEGRGVGGFIMYLVQAFMDLFETLISQFSNTLSYVRVGAFAVAHGGLSLAIFNLAGDEMGLGFWITVIIGNLFIIGFEGLIVGIQTMRLHYYEFLGKFFTGGGMRFEPLTTTPAKEEG
jgi:V/A-type H+-transporting ATPase subunit I